MKKLIESPEINHNNNDNPKCNLNNYPNINSDTLAQSQRQAVNLKPKFQPKPIHPYQLLMSSHQLHAAYSIVYWTSPIVAIFLYRRGEPLVCLNVYLIT